MTNRMKRGGPGWRLDSTRHSLAARGIKTSGLSSSKLSDIRMIALQRRKKELNLRRENKPHLNVLMQYLAYRRTFKGVGRLYSIFDARKAHADIKKSGDRYSIKKADDIMQQIEVYHAADFVPRVKLTKLERAKTRALVKKKTGKDLTPLEKRALVKVSTI